ncbi:beta-glucosidase [Anaerocolumna cellulosilytica]|uniref:Beta-glucosidase n=1 Tax=Anaerocolumna cellulosilytica TaxID=433286 RepID=A0A6S6QWR8_9FIRM|nr:glycoside hydrolase family 3 N-terminal domain-containing protein [Anaerocolumna cellulosilytica]MBB5193719.1 beta-glucosidase [Anaerocolumna cellulosilytica]BCJ95064.1 beta-glucosidase [Anaerocolumna cellulosilytica]
MKSGSSNDLLVQEKAEYLLSQMTLDEKIGQVNQRLYGFRIYERVAGQDSGEDEIVLSEEFKEEVRRFGGLGVLYGLYRADPWSQKDYSTGLDGPLATKAYNQIQRYVIEHSRLGIPMLLSSECPHGHQALHGYLLPVNLAMGATFHPSLVEKAYRVCGKQMREMGVDMALISALDILRDPRWGRSEECYGEDPYLAAEFAKALVRGVQSEQVAVVAKHFCAQGEGTGGINASAARIGERELREIHLPAMKACCEEGVQGVMAAYNEIDGVPCHGNSMLLKEILRNEMGFQGVVMADGVAIDQLDSMTGDNVSSSALALRSGVDIGLWDDAFGKLSQAIAREPALEKELDRAVLRVLTMKYERGLFEKPYIEESSHYTTYHYDTYKESLQLARESVVLLENKTGLLPLAFKEIKTLAVIGPNSDEIYHQLGDYTPPVSKEDGVTVLKGIQKMVEEYGYETGHHVEVVYAKGCGLMDKEEDEIAEAVSIARQSDVIVMVLGGSSSRFGKVIFDSNGAAKSGEKVTMDCGEGVDASDLSLPGLQIQLAKEMFLLGKPVIAISIQGRPYALTEISEGADALLCSFYPGIKGGEAIAEILFGKISPSGCLPVSLPRHCGQIPVYYNYKSSYRAMDYYDVEKTPLYSFGYGKSYTNFSYHNIRVEGANEKKKAKAAPNKQFTFSKTGIEKQGIKIHVCATNTGKMDGYSVLQVYLRQMCSDTVRRVKELKAFKKIWIPAGMTKECTLELKAESFSCWNANMQFVMESSVFQLHLHDGEGLLHQEEITII